MSLDNLRARSERLNRDPPDARIGPASELPPADRRRRRRCDEPLSLESALPDCRLQTLERYVCSRQRVGDIPGFEIPAAYHAFVRTRDARELRDIVQHNFLDLVTMAEVLVELLRD